jgi:hypothetical protein
MGKVIAGFGEEERQVLLVLAVSGASIFSSGLAVAVLRFLVNPVTSTSMTPSAMNRVYELRTAMTELSGRFEQSIGQAALQLWSDLPRDLQERLFEDAVGSDEQLRHQLAVYLHQHHPRTAHPPRPTAFV